MSVAQILTSTGAPVALEGDLAPVEDLVPVDREVSVRVAGFRKLSEEEGQNVAEIFRRPLPVGCDYVEIEVRGDIPADGTLRIDQSKVDVDGISIFKITPGGDVYSREALSVGSAVPLDGKILVRLPRLEQE